MPIALRLRGVLLSHTLVVGILPNTQHCYVLQLRSCNDSCVPDNLRHQSCALPPLSSDTSDLSSLLAQMRLNPALYRELMRARCEVDTYDWSGDMRLVFLVTPETEGPLERFLNRHFCDHVVVIDGFAVAHNIDYSRVVNPPVAWDRHAKYWNPDRLDQRVYRDRYGLAVLVRAIALSPLDARFNPELPYLFFTARDCRVRMAQPAAPRAVAPQAFHNMLLSQNQSGCDLSLADLSLGNLTLGGLSLGAWDELALGRAHWRKPGSCLMGR